MAHLIDLFGELLPAISNSALDDDLKGKLADALFQENPDNLMALAPTLFSIELYTKANELVSDTDLFQLSRDGIPLSGAIAAVDSVMGIGSENESALHKATLAAAVPLDKLISSVVGAMSMTVNTAGDLAGAAAKLSVNGFSHVAGIAFQKTYYALLGVAMRTGNARAAFSVASMTWSLDQLTTGKLAVNHGYQQQAVDFRSQLSQQVKNWQSINNQFKTLPAGHPERATLQAHIEAQEGKIHALIKDSPRLFTSFDGQPLRTKSSKALTPRAA